MGEGAAVRLNLGCSDRLLPAKDGWVNVDLPQGLPKTWSAEFEVDFQDLSKRRWKWDDSTVDEIAAFDVIEHLESRITTMNEIHRILKPGGVAHIIVPNAAKGAGFFQDPTHKTPWCRNSFQYFEHGSFAHRRLARPYGITAAFKILSLNESSYKDAFEEVWKIDAKLEAVK